MSRSEDAHPRPIATVDLVIFRLGEEGLQTLLTRRRAPPFKGALALPGGFVRPREDADLEAAARRVLAAKTRVAHPHLEQLMTVGDAERDPRDWSISVSYLSLIAPGGASAEDDVWAPVAGEGVGEPLAFDHARIVSSALRRLRDKVSYSTLPAHFLGEAFTLTELQGVYERVLDRKLDKSVFRKRMAELDFIEPISGGQRRGSNRPAQLYRLRRAGATTLMDRTI
jgi:ADP-ribose pyrophosphatase YjhB (NUDIX family)